LRALVRFSLGWTTRPSTAVSPADKIEPEPRERGVSRPICAASTPWQRNPHRLFCSLTCRLVDLGVWLDEGYRVADDERGDVP